MTLENGRGASSATPTNQALSASLRDGSVWGDWTPGRRWQAWSPPPVPANIDAIISERSMHDSASDLVDELLSHAGSVSWLKLTHEKRYHRVDVVEELIDRAVGLRDKLPADAVACAERAAAIAEVIDPSTEVHYLRGFAQKELANALVARTNYIEALAALDRAEAHYSNVSASEFQLAVVTLVRAIVLQRLERADEAVDLVNSSAAVFLRYEHADLYAQARMVEAMLLYSLDRHEEMRDVQLPLIKQFRASDRLDLLASVYNNLGFCYEALHQPSLAVEAFMNAEALYRELGMSAMLPTVRWGLGRMQCAAGSFEEALPMMVLARDDLARVGKTASVAKISLEVAELQIILGRNDEAAETLRPVSKLFLDAGIPSGAIAAANYAHELASLRKATPQLIRQIRQYVKQLELQPGLPFCPPEG